MTNRLKRLELTWIGKEDRPRLEPRILLEEQELSYAKRISNEDIFDNRLIYGDNLLALKALEQEFTGKFRCVYIDPPFNTGQAFEEYNDGIEHSIWLTLLRDRLQILHSLLADDGTLYVHIDDNELGYLIVLLDEIWGRANRASIITFKQGAPTGHKAINPGCVTTTNFVLIYAKDKSKWSPNRLFVARDRDKRYSQFVLNRNEPYDKWEIVPLIEGYAAAEGIDVREARAQTKAEPELLDAFVMKNVQSVCRLARPDYKAVSEAARNMIDRSKAKPERIFHLTREDHSDFFFIRGERILFYENKIKVIDGQEMSGEPLTTLWDDLLSNNLHKEGGVAFPKNKKPEALLKRALELSTKPGDWVLDSFAGSGTTGAVAQKMGRRWVMIELGEHCHSLILPRIRSVIDGTDASGVTSDVGWKGGGGFRFFKLAPSLLEKDKWGNWIVSKQYKPEMLAEAMCKLEGFRYAPDREVFWNHGHSTERDFIYVTTQNLSPDQLRFISEQVGPERTLLICCGAFRGKPDFPNLTVKKIPQAVLSRCEWGKVDYSLNVTEQAPVVAVEEAKADASTADGTKTKTGGRRKKATPVQALPLFAGIDNGSK
ncbi:site-specific DNA-methyltransferase [Myxococcus sp. AM009]|uniref:site-specific DNA-methyltransferase n=1 Tax=Myxococcus sp. AM009 TaxID=2745137 RepID=UPI001595CD4F|nr:site-specific DNA-methyltransferase [Myxococcus sp. AM009]NVI98472.1 site-specific DNA-methyltransferase [Myxococcus sp. AM009]